MKLVIISHTEHYKTDTGTIVGWGPTVNEINHLLDVFDEIYHLAMLYPNVAPASSMAYISDRIKFVPIPSVGGQGLFNKLKIIGSIPKTIGIVSNTFKKVDCFQLRTPTGIGVYLIPYLTFFTKKKGWFKYAGNWNQKSPPLGYRFQRWLLINQNRKVTINGQWPNQPKHCITFENPCLEDKNLAEGIATMENKSYNDKLSFCFVGRLEREKGVERIIKAFSALPEALKERVNEVHLVGDGKDFNHFKALAETTGITFKFYKFLSRDEVFTIYKQSHVFLLPSSASEGFPKVIAEAMNFGCLPIVSNISSIGQYIHDDKNGLLLNEITIEGLVLTLTKVLKYNDPLFKPMVGNNRSLVKRFTFSYYNSRILKDVLAI